VPDIVTIDTVIELLSCTTSKCWNFLYFFCSAWMYSFNSMGCCCCVVLHITQVGDRVTKQQLKSTSYWLPEYQPEHVRAKIAKPPARPPSPNTGEGLRLKDLFPVKEKMLQ
jgi:hypothetical protein